MKKKKETFFFFFFNHHSLGLFIKFLPHDILWSSVSVQHMWLLVYVSSCSSFHTHIKSLQFFQHPCDALRSGACKVQMPSAKPLKNNTDSESGCVAALRSSGRVFFIIFILGLSAVAL